MICQFEKLVYPSKMSAVESGSYMVVLYRPCERIKDTSGNLIPRVKAVGFCLPVSDSFRYDIKGHWTRNAKHGLEFEVESFDEVIIPNRENIIAYLSSGQIKGIGPKTAERIYDAFGNSTLDILDEEPEKLLSISGISENKLRKIQDSYLANRSARDVVAFLVPYGITPNRAVQFFKEYGNKAMDIVRNHPYELCNISGIGFFTADKIALNMGFGELSTDRVDQGLIYTLREAEKRGHLCMDKHELVSKCLKLLKTEGLTEDMVANRGLSLLKSGQIVSYNGNAFRSSTAYAEQHLAQMVSQHMRSSLNLSYGNLDMDIDKEESNLGVTLAHEQREAVKTALTNKISIITGGPGTGKTMIQKILLTIYQKNNSDKEICCCAPTGRAARRLEQSTGYPAHTLHKALGLYAGSDGHYSKGEKLDADFVLVDEVSMTDIYLAVRLLEALKPDAQLVLIGDADQLPSVGPGAVLSEFIASERIPTVRLETIFRQKNGSLVASNAKLINNMQTKLDYGMDFQFFVSETTADSAELIADLFLQEVTHYGIDNVAILSPYRHKTETGVNALNEKIRDIINPPVPGKSEIEFGKRIFRCGDKVMQMQNYVEVNNGDIGYITKITSNGGEKSVLVDFGDGRIMEYDSLTLEMLDLGYACTIHKSQGAEYKSVIINIQYAHTPMLTKQLIYTAVTRSKERVILVGERKALYIGIKRTDTEKRGTCLASRLKEMP